MDMNEHIFEHTKRLEARVASLEVQMDKLPKKEDVDDIVRAAMKETFLSVGQGTKVAIMTTAAIVGSMAIIGGGLKWLLALAGFTYLGGSGN